MAIALVNFGSAGAGSGTILSSGTFAINSGNLLVVYVFEFLDYKSVSSVTDTAGNTYTRITGTFNTNSTWGVEAWYAKNTTSAASGSVNVNFGTTNATKQLIYLQYSGVNTSAPLDVSATGTGSGSLMFTGNMNTTFANEVVTSGIAGNNNGTITALGGFTLEARGTGANTPIGVEDKILSGTATTAGTFSLNGAAQNWNGVAASFKAASGAGTNLIQSTGTAVLGLGSTSVTWPGNTTTGNLIVVGVTLTNAAALGTVSSVTDSQSNSYTKAISGTLSSLGDVLNTELWYASNVTGGPGSVTVNHTIDNCSMFAREYSGFQTLDVTSAANGSSTTPNSGTSSATAVGTELVIVATGDDKGATQTWTAAGNYGDMVGTATTITGLSMEDNIVTSTGVQTGTLTLGAAANWESLLATFMPPISGGAIVGWRNLLGVGQG